MQERSSHKAMTPAAATVKQNPNDMLYLFTGEGIRPSFATRATTKEEAEENYAHYLKSHHQ